MVESKSDEVVNFAINPAELPTEYLAAVGSTCAAFNIAEMTLVSIIHALSGVDTEVGNILTAHMTTPNRLSAFKALAYLRFEGDQPSMLSEALDIAAAFDQAAGARARIVHPYMAYDEDAKTVRRGIVKAREKLQRSFEEHSVEQINTEIFQITELIRRLVRFSVVFRGWEGDLPNGRTQQELEELLGGMKNSIASEYAERVARKARGAAKE